MEKKDAVAAPVITTQPADVEAAEGEAVRLTVRANGSGLAYQWQWGTDNKTWKNCRSAGSATDTFSFTMKDTLAGRYYRCVVTNQGGSVNSRSALISLPEEGPGLGIISQAGDVSAEEGGRVELHVEVDSSVVSYQWQWSADGKTWKNCTSAGADTDTFRFTMKQVLAGRHYRCVVSSDSEEICSEDILISLAEGAEALEITSQPEPVEAAEGAAVSFHVGANRTGASYQWQWSKDGKTWKNCTSAGSNTDTFSFTMKEVLSGRYYRCVVSADGQTKESEGALITLAQDTEALAITSQPEPVEAAEGAAVSFHVGANRSDAAYQWQWSADGKTWKNCTSAGATTDTFRFTMKEILSGRDYRCVVTAGGKTVTSEPAKITLASTDIVIDGVVYEVVSGEMTVTGYRGNAESVTVQETVNGQTVTVIGESAFENNTAIKQIDLPDTIRVIRKRAFAGCSSLAKMD